MNLPIFLSISYIKIHGSACVEDGQPFWRKNVPGFISCHTCFKAHRNSLRTLRRADNAVVFELSEVHPGAYAWQIKPLRCDAQFGRRFLYVPRSVNPSDLRSISLCVLYEDYGLVQRPVVRSTFITLTWGKTKVRNELISLVRSVTRAVPSISPHSRLPHGTSLVNTSPIVRSPRRVLFEPGGFW